MYFALVQANIGRRVKPIEDVRSMMEQLRSAWNEVSVQSRKAAVQERGGGLNVTG